MQARLLLAHDELAPAAQADFDPITGSAFIQLEAWRSIECRAADEFSKRAYFNHYLRLKALWACILANGALP